MAFELLSLTLVPDGIFIAANALPGGLSAQTTLLEIQLPDKTFKKFVVRRPPPWALKKDALAALTEYNLLKKLRILKVDVPNPVLIDQEGTFFGTPCLVVDYIVGKTDFSPLNISDSLRQMAFQLSKIHGIRKDSWDVAISEKDAQIFPRKKEIDYSPEENRTRDFLEKIWPIPNKNSWSLVHGDFWPGNMLWKDGTFAATIDWEAAGLADPLLDLSITRLDILWLFGAEAMHELTELYLTLTNIDSSDLPYWDLWAGLRTGGKFDLWASVYPGLGRPDVTAASMRNAHSYFINEAFRKILSMSNESPV
jgi:aminoglycoside phosphotransferase (APT) family kinase protein